MYKKKNIQPPVKQKIPFSLIFSVSSDRLFFLKKTALYSEISFPGTTALIVLSYIASAWTAGM